MLGSLERRYKHVMCGLNRDFITEKTPLIKKKMQVGRVTTQLSMMIQLVTSAMSTIDPQSHIVAHR